MEHKLIRGGAIVLALLLAAAVVAVAQQSDGDEKITGKVIQVLPPLVKVEAEGKTYVVHAGPARRWQREKFQLKPGDEIQVEGVRIEEIDGVVHLRADRIVRGNVTLILAERRGPRARYEDCGPCGCRHHRGHHRGHRGCRHCP